MKSVLKIVAEPAIDHSFSIKDLDSKFLDTGYFVRLNYNHILVIENGKGTLMVDDHSFEIMGNEVFLLSKGQVYQFEKQSEVEGYCISFGDCFWEKAPSSASNCKAVLFNNAAANQRLEPNKQEMTGFLLLCTALMKEYKTSQYINQMDVMAAYLKILMVKLANVKGVEEETFDSQDYLIYRKFLELLSRQYYQYHAVNDYAVMLNMTSRRLSDLCKRCSNKSTKEIINGQILAEAKRLLQFSSQSVKEIAYLLNFSTPEQFSHFFKKNTTISPANFRSNFMGIPTDI